MRVGMRKKLKITVIIVVIVFAFLYFKVAQHNVSVATACYGYEIKKEQREGSYYLILKNNSNKKIKCTKEQYDKITHHAGYYYGIEFDDNSFLSKYMNYKPKVTKITKNKIDKKMME